MLLLTAVASNSSILRTTRTTLPKQRSKTRQPTLPGVAESYFQERRVSLDTRRRFPVHVFHCTPNRRIAAAEISKGALRAFGG